MFRGWREDTESHHLSGINYQNSSQNLEACVVLSLAALGFIPLEMGRALLPVQPQPSEPSCLPHHGRACASSCGHRSWEPLWSHLPFLSCFLSFLLSLGFYLVKPGLAWACMFYLHLQSPSWFPVFSHLHRPFTSVSSGAELRLCMR